MMKTLTIKRLLAFCIDYLIFALYGVALFVMVRYLGLTSSIDSPWTAQLVGFTCLTFPVFLYFVWFEASARKATLGKVVLHLEVEAKTTIAVIKRNVLKLVPWEVAHTGVHWLFYYNRLDQEPPIWVFVLLISSQVMACIYIIKIWKSHGETSWYDIWANTRVSSS